MKNLVFISSLFIFFTGLAQAKLDSGFIASKGTWDCPLKHLKSISWPYLRSVHALNHQNPVAIFTGTLGDSVFSVYKVTVKGVFMVGDFYAMMIQYGKYYLTYCNLQKPVFKKGDEVKQNQYLGTLDSNTDDLQFAFSDSADKILDPQPWFVRDTTLAQIYTIETPDGWYMNLQIISKIQSDSLEKQYFKNKIEDSFLSSHQSVAYKIDQGQVLYRQFFKSIGFIFPSEPEFNKAVRSDSYFEVSLQPTDSMNNYVLTDNQYSRIAASFSLKPIYAHQILSDIQSPVSGYAAIDSYHFYYLKDSSIVMVMPRTDKLSDSYWFKSLEDFDFFYWIYAGKNKPKNRATL